MLPGDDRLQNLISVVGPLKFTLQLPIPMEEYFSSDGVILPIPDEQRRFVRRKSRVRGFAVSLVTPWPPKGP